MSENQAEGEQPVDEETGEETCRVCVDKNSDGQLSDIFSGSETRNIAEEIFFCTGVLITQTDNGSKKICNSCLDNLETSNKFKTDLLNSERKVKGRDNYEPKAIFHVLDCSSSDKPLEEVLRDKVNEMYEGSNDEVSEPEMNGSEYELDYGDHDLVRNMNMDDSDSCDNQAPEDVDNQAEGQENTAQPDTTSKTIEVENGYECNECKKHFKYKDDYTNHNLRKHNVEKEESRCVIN